MNALLHGSVGGLAAVANNGKFKTGFLTSLSTTAFVKMSGVGVGHYLSETQTLVASATVSALIAKDQGGDPWFSVGMAIIQTYFNASGGSLGDKRSNLDKELPIGMGAFDDLHEGIEGEFGGGGKGRKGSFKEAKNKASIPKSQQPDRVRHERLTDQPGNVHSREYDFTRTKDGAQVTIREHSLGHKKGNLGPHFNTEIRPRGGGPRQPLSRGADDHTFF